MERSRKRARYEYSSLENAARDVTPDIYGERQKIKEKVLSEAAAAADGEFSDDDFDFSQISDAIAVAQHLIKVAVKDKHNHSESVQKLPKICFVHQIYSLLPDNTAVDRMVGKWWLSATTRKCICLRSDQLANMSSSRPWQLPSTQISQCRGQAILKNSRLPARMEALLCGMFEAPSHCVSSALLAM